MDKSPNQRKMEKELTKEKKALERLAKELERKNREEERGLQREKKEADKKKKMEEMALVKALILEYYWLYLVRYVPSSEKLALETERKAKEAEKVGVVVLLSNYGYLINGCRKGGCSKGFISPRLKW